MFLVLRLNLVFLSLFLCLCNTSLAQQGNISFRKLGVEDGLSHVTINDILQDRYGFLWIGTSDGLNRYNGYEFKVFKQHPGDSNSLQNNNVRAIFEGNDHRMWLGTSDGFHVYNRLDGTFQKLSETTGEAIYGLVYDIIPESEEELWVGSSAGLALFNTKTYEAKLVISKQVLGTVHRLLRTVNGQLWIGSLSKGVFRYDISGKSLHPYEEVNEESPVWGFQVDRSGRLWMGTNGAGLWWFDQEGDQLQRFQKPGLSNENVLSMMEDEESNLWVGTDKGGLNRIDAARSRSYHYPHQPADPTSLSSSDIRQIFQDKQGVIWLGTWGGGLNFFNPSQLKFSRFTASEQPGKGHSLNDNFVQAILETSNGDAWIGTKKGINVIDAKTGLVTDPLQLRGLELSNDYVKSIHKDSYGRIWIGTHEGLNVFDARSGKLKQYYESPNGLSYDDFSFFYEDRQNRLWIGTWKGLNLFNQETGNFENDDIPKDLRKKAVLSMTEDQNGKLWIGTYYSGLFLYDPESGELAQFREGEKVENISNDRIWALHTDASGRVWAGTFGGGLNRVVIDGDGYRFQRITESDGLANNAIIAVQSDQNGALWIASNKGITRYDPGTKEFRSYNSKDGLQGDHFNAASFKGSSGKLYFGGSKGLSVFDPLDFDFEPEAPGTLIESFQLFNKPVLAGEGSVLSRPIMETSSITLNHEQRVFSFAFSTDHFDHPKETLFAYQLEGVDPDWVETSHRRRYVNYTSVPAGTHIFKVRAIDKWGNTGPITSLEIVILPPWWKTWWFISLMVVLAITIMYGWYRLKVRQIKRQNQKLEKEVSLRTGELKESHDQLRRDKEVIQLQADRLKELDKVKSRFFANISHELRTPLTLINAPLEALIREKSIRDEEIKQTLEVARKNGHRLLSLVEEILDLAKLEAGKLKLVENPVRVKEFAKDLLTAYQSKAMERNIDLSLNTNIPDELTVFCDERKCGKVLHNLLSNAMKFVEDGGKVSLEISEAGDTLSFRLTDNGPGIHPNDLPRVFDRFYQSEQPGKKAEGGTGIGLALSRELASLMGGTLTATSEPDKETAFTFTMRARKLSEEVLVPMPEQESEKLEGVLKQTIEKYNQHFEVEKPVLLVTEDHPEMRAFVARTLRPYFEIEEADNGKKALEVLNSKTVDIVVSDVMMPVMDGFELLEAVKKNEKLNDVSIVMLTARAEAEDKLQALTLGIDDYLTKPFSAAEFLARIKNILEYRIKVIRSFQQLREENNQSIDHGHAQVLEQYGLSEREADVVRLLARRYSNQEIANELFISLNTVKFHVKNIYMKLGVANRSEVVNALESAFPE